MLYEKIKQEVQRVSGKINETEKQLAQFPEGHLSCLNNGPYTKWYHVLPGGREYIPKKDRNLAEQLAYKQFFDAHLQDLKREQDALQAYLSHYQNPSLKTEILMENSQYTQLLTNVCKTINQEMAEWAKAPYDRNTAHPEYLRFKSVSGNIVRSKSESFIDQALYMRGIPFRYEAALTINDITLYPDFTIRHPYTGNLWLWEHFGMMDSEPYIQKTLQKLRIYFSNGYIPTINLITTYESQKHPLDMETVMEVVQHYFG